MGFDRIPVHRHPRIGNLRTLIISDARLDMEGPLRTEGEYLWQFVQDKALADIAPMTEVDGQFDRGEPRSGGSW